MLLASVAACVLSGKEVWGGVANRYWRLPVYFMPTCIMEKDDGLEEEEEEEQQQQQQEEQQEGLQQQQQNIT